MEIAENYSSVLRNATSRNDRKGGGHKTALVDHVRPINHAEVSRPRPANKTSPSSLMILTKRFATGGR